MMNSYTILLLTLSIPFFNLSFKYFLYNISFSNRKHQLTSKCWLLHLEFYILVSNLKILSKAKIYKRVNISSFYLYHFTFKSRKFIDYFSLVHWFLPSFFLSFLHLLCLFFGLQDCTQGLAHLNLPSTTQVHT